MDFRKVIEWGKGILSLLIVLCFVILYLHGSVEAEKQRYKLPMIAKVYDRSNKAIITYESTNVVKDGILYLNDASELYRIDVSEMIE